MKHPWKHLFALSGMALCLGALPARAQEPSKDSGTPEKSKVVEPKQDAPKKDEPEPIRITPRDLGGDEHAKEHEEMEKLFGEIERKMGKVNQLLERASAGQDTRTAVKETVESIDKLLQESQTQSASTVKDIDRILELASRPHPGGT